MKHVLIALVAFYRKFLSPLKPPTCRFHPTCSAYAIEALRGHGALRGAWLTLKRLLRCQPFCKSGEDPVPPPRRRGGEVDVPEPTPGRAPPPR
ncbi:MAG: membrane protein insertion efficiency factor YidD [Planctomycetes bacterium]|nr:membrane protein insertion efficiency factor YidD [Planctomycetota bacterium]